VTVAVRSSLERESGAQVEVTPNFHCESGDRCIEEIRTRARAEEVVMLKMFAGPTRIRILAERVGAGTRTSISSEAELKQDQEAWSAALEGVAKKLFPEGAGTMSAVAITPQDNGSTRRDLKPLISAATSAVLLGVGGVFIARRSSDQNELSPGVVPPATFWSNHSRWDQDTALAVGFLSAGVVGLALGVFWALRD
jgi:hypothetical protein